MRFQLNISNGIPFNGKLPAGYADMTVKDIAEKAGGWSADEVGAALEYERAHGVRKGALAALEAQEEK